MRELVNGDFAKLAIGLTGGKFSFRSLFKIKIASVKPIVAPGYRLFPETTEADQIASSKATYGLEERR